MTAIMAVVEDESGGVLKIQLYQQVDEDERSATDIIDVGTILLLKEPFFKVMGEFKSRRWGSMSSNASRHRLESFNRHN